MALKPLQTDQAPLVETSSGKPTAVFYTWLKSFYDAFRTLLTSTDALFGLTGPAWTAYTPVATASTGTITTYTATGRSYQLGKVVFFQFFVSIINRGTGAGDLLVTLPVSANASFNYALAGWEDDAPAGAMGLIQGGASARVRYSNGTTLVVNGVDVTITGVYEAA